MGVKKDLIKKDNKEEQSVVEFSLKHGGEGKERKIKVL